MMAPQGPSTILLCWFGFHVFARWRDFRILCVPSLMFKIPTNSRTRMSLVIKWNLRPLGLGFE